MSSRYEAHRHPDPLLPIFFHRDTVRQVTESGHLHWHEAIELLYCIEGEGTAISDGDRLSMRTGDLLVINSNHLHSIYSATECRYDCLIVSPALFAEHDIPYGEIPLIPHIQDPRIGPLFEAIRREMQEAAPYYRTAVRSVILDLYVLLFRSYAGSRDEIPHPAGSRLEIAKSVIAYLRHHFAEDISMDALCREIGFSKYYVCHAFKEITGQTVVGYLNFLRCTQARALLSAGSGNISQCAAQSGFHNLSYFTRTYKHLMGELPSENRKSTVS